MAVYECSVTCRTCTRHDDAPLVLVAESVDHAQAGKDHHDRQGACWAASERHAQAFPGHELEVAHATPAQLAARAKRDDRIAAERQAVSREVARLTNERIARRRAQLETGKADA